MNQCWFRHSARNLPLKLRFHPTLGRLPTQLQPQLLVKPIDTLAVHIPALSPEQHVDPSVAVTHARLGDLPDPLI